VDLISLSDILKGGVEKNGEFIQLIDLQQLVDKSREDAELV